MGGSLHTDDGKPAVSVFLKKGGKVLTSNLHGPRSVPVCHITGEPLAMQNDWNDPIDSWCFFVDGRLMRGHLHADGTQHEFVAE